MYVEVCPSQHFLIVFHLAWHFGHFVESYLWAVVPICHLRLNICQIVACVTLHPWPRYAYALCILGEIMKSCRIREIGSLVTGKGCAVSQMGMLSLKGLWTGMNKWRKWRRAKKRRSKQRGLIYGWPVGEREMWCYGLARLRQNPHTSIHTHLTHGEMRVTCCEQGFCNRYFSPPESWSLRCIKQAAETSINS